MKITNLLTLQTINLNAKANNKKEALELAIKTICASGAINDVKKYSDGVFARELESTTGVGEEIAIPHCKSDAVSRPALAAIIFKDGVDYDSLDGEKVKLLFLIAAPNNEENVHLDVLARLSNLLMYPEFKDKLLNAIDKTDFLKIIDDAEFDKLSADEKKEMAKYPKVLAATACPTGIAHTYMAQEALEKAANKLGITIKVETNGSGGTKNKLTDEEIEYAEGIIVAADAMVEMDRFAGKRLIQCAVSKAIKEPESLIEAALDPITSIYRRGEKATKQDKAMSGSKFHIFYKHLMSGISHMIPFVVAGGILLAIAYLIDACSGVASTAEKFGQTTVAAQIFHILGGDLGLGLMLPVLAGFIAYDIAGRPALVSGFVGGFAASKGVFSLLYFIEDALHGHATGTMADMMSKSAAGFLGAIVAGFIAGYFTLFFKKKLEKLPKTLEGLSSILIIPLVTTFVVGASMLLINVPLSFVNIGISKGLLELNKLNLIILLAALVSGLMATDMGGPINKAAHYAVLLIYTNASLSKDPTSILVAEKLMCANIVGIMTPPIGIALATWLFPQKFIKDDRTPSVANCVTGMCGITEGAIPYLAKDPVRVLISTITGAAVGGMIAVALGGRAIAPEGGTISMIIMGAVCWKGLLATLIGSLVTCFLLGFLKKDVSVKEASLKRWKGIPTQPVYNLFGKLGHKIGKIFNRNKKVESNVKEDK